MVAVQLSLWDFIPERVAASLASVPDSTEASPAIADGGIGSADTLVNSVCDLDLSDEEGFSQACLRAGFARNDIMANPCHRCPFEGLCDEDDCAALLFNTDVASKEYDPDAAEESYLSFLYR